MSDVTVHTLGDLADVQTGPFGSQLHSSDYVDEGTPIITVEHLVADSRISHDRIPRVSVSDTARLARYSLQLGDLVQPRWCYRQVLLHFPKRGRLAVLWSAPKSKAKSIPCELKVPHCASFA